MPKHSKNARVYRTDLTWEDQNPSSYRFNDKALTKLKETIKKVKKEKVKTRRP